MRPDGPFCRACISWKRKTSDSGVCWNADNAFHGSVVSEHDTCERFAEKVITEARPDGLSDVPRE